MATPLRRVAGSAALGIAAALLAGCAREAPPFEPIGLVADRGAGTPGPFVEAGATVTIDGVPRTSIDAVTPLTPPTETIPQPRGRRLRARIPAEFGAVPWLVLESVVTSNGVASMMRSWPVTGGVAGTSYDVAVVEARIGPDDTTGVVIWAAPDLATRDVTTHAVDVPPHAVLEVAAGLQTASWSSTAIPVTMTITALTDGETVLRALRVDPRLREGQRWTDLALPLDAFAGRTVRFRFSSRPIVGPSAVPTLPVWSAPQLVDARTLGR